MDTLLTANLIANNFELEITDATGNQMKMDTPINQGGNGRGMRPMQTLLAALIGCSTVDVVLILKKQRQTITTFKVTVAGERQENIEPSLWQKIHLNFMVTGNIDAEKLNKAVALSIEKYCSVAETLRRAGAVITFTTTVI
jgi:putative redox protein